MGVDGRLIAPGFTLIAGGLLDWIAATASSPKGWMTGLFDFEVFLSHFHSPAGSDCLLRD